MAKRLGISIVLLLAVLAGAYYLRIQLVTEAINRSLRDSDLVLLRLQQLEIGFDGLDLGELVFSVGPDRTEQSLRQVHLGYSLLQARPQQLEIGHATLQLPPGRDDAAVTAITDLLTPLFQVPLDSISIAALDVPGWSHPLLQFPIAAKAQWQQDQVELILLASGLELVLAMQDKSDQGLRLELDLATNGRAAAALDLGLSDTGDTVQISGKGELELDSLSGLLAPILPVPEQLTGLDGVIPFTLSALLNNTLSASALQQASIEVQAETQVRLTASGAAAPAWDAHMAIHMPQGLTLKISAAEPGQTRAHIAADQLTVTLAESLHGLAAQGSLQQLSCGLIELSCEALLSATAHAPELVAENGARLESPRLTLVATAAISADGLSLGIAPGELLRVALLEQGGLLARDPVLVNEAPASVNYRFKDAELSAQAQRLNLQLPRLKLPELNIATNAVLSGLHLSWHPGGDPNGSARLVADGINLQRPSGWLPALALDSNIKLAQGLLSLDAQLGSGRSRELFGLTADYNLGQGQLQGQLRTNDIRFNPGSKRLSGHFASWPYPWDILQGKLAVQADINWPGSGDKPLLSAAIDSSWEDLAGTYQEIGFVNLDGKASAVFTSPDQLLIARDARISLQRLDIGIPIENIEASFKLDSRRQQLQIPSLEARLFGGRVWTEDVTYRANRRSNRVDIGVDGLQLAQLLDATGYDAVQGTGSISGLLPLNINAKGITMTRGMLAAKDPGGIFRYKAELAADSNAALAQVSEALGNYHYTIFQTEADYLENGDLELSMQLRGRNPDMAQARPIHLNLNLTDNIPMLLRSLQSGRTIADLVSSKMEDSRK